MTDHTPDAPLSGALIDSTAPPGLPAAVDARSILLRNNVLQILTNGAWYIGIPFLPLYLAAQGASAAVIGAVVGLSGIVPLLVAIQAGIFVDARGPRGVFVASVVLFGIGGALLTGLHGILAAGLAYTLMSLANIGFAVAAQAIVAAMSTDATRVRNYGYYSVWNAAGSVVGPILGGLIAGRFGYRGAFLVLSLLMVPALAATASLSDVPPPARRPRVSFFTAYGLAGTILRQRGVGTVMFISAMMVCAQQLQATFYPLYLHKVGLPAAQIGLVIAAISLAMMVVRTFLVRGVEALGSGGTLLFALIVIAAAFALTPLARAFWPLVGVSALMGTSLGFTQPLSMSLLVECISAEFWGAGFGIRQSLQRVSAIVAPLFFGVVSTARGVEWAFYAGAITFAGAAGVMSKVGRRIGRESAPEEA